ncbi:pilus assembly PilX family protein [Amphritea sp. HPY]|uniref:pilus assembly PilX family protein n=1 Tax=Amphritea sp. HPY TaxID=3421652 RepID=UPI003D7C75D1
MDMEIRNKPPQMLYARQKQAGATLIVALIILLVMSISSASALQNITLQERMAANMLDKTIAFHAAEDALVEAEEWLLDGTQTRDVKKYPDDNAENIAVIYTVSGTENLKQKLMGKAEGDLKKWQQYALSAEKYGASENELMKIQVQVTIEKTGSNEYRILSRSTGRSGNAEVILESIVNK